MTVVFTRSILALLVKAIKTVLNSPFGVTCLTYYWFHTQERGNEDINIQHMLQE